MLVHFSPGWIKRLFTSFISFTLKLVLQGQVSMARDPPTCHPGSRGCHLWMPLLWLLSCLVRCLLCPLQVCKEISVISNIMADFVQSRAGEFSLCISEASHGSRKSPTSPGARGTVTAPVGPVWLCHLVTNYGQAVASHFSLEVV